MYAVRKGVAGRVCSRSCTVACGPQSVVVTRACSHEIRTSKKNFREPCFNPCSRATPTLQELNAHLCLVKKIKSYTYLTLQIIRWVPPMFLRFCPCSSFIQERKRVLWCHSYQWHCKHISHLHCNGPRRTTWYRDALCYSVRQSHKMLHFFVIKLYLNTGHCCIYCSGVGNCTAGGRHVCSVNE